MATDFSSAYLNIRGLASKLEEVRLILNDRKFNILCLAETFLDENDDSCLYEMPGYVMIRRDRLCNNGGGLLCYVQDSLVFEHMQNLDLAMEESVTIMIKPRHQKSFLVTYLYRPPQSKVSWNSDFSEFVERCYALNNEIIIFGDFNIDLLNQTSKNRWIDNVTSPLLLKQLISEPTRVTNTSRTLIDHIYSSNCKNILEAGIIKYTLSDHYMIMASRKMVNGTNCSKQRCKVTFLDYSLATPENIFNIFSQENFNYVLNEKSIDKMFEKFHIHLNHLIAKLVSEKTRFVKTYSLPKWLDDEVKENIKIRNRLKQDGNWDEYRKQRNKVTNMIKKKKKELISQTIKESKGNTKPIWDIVMNKKKKKIQPESDLSANQFNSHFVSIAKSITKNLGETVGDMSFPAPEHNLSEIPKFTPFTCTNILFRIPNKKSTGPDGMSVKILKLIWPYIVGIVTDMFNRILIEGIFPSMWKLARVSPIYKSGDINNPSNYRPISVLPVLSKIFEKHVNVHLQEYLTKNKIIHELQCGFRKGHSCSDNLFKVVSDCLMEKLNGRMITLLFLDFKKAFDCVSHCILHRKLQACGIAGNLLKLLDTFLADRKQFVKLKGIESHRLPITIGVPQGSILAPTLFLIFINDLLTLSKTDFFTSSSFAYADDTVFLTSGNNLQQLKEKTSENLNIIVKWCNRNHMVINVQKSHYMLLNSCDLVYDLGLYIGNEKLDRKRTTKLLGFVMNDSLSWQDHIDAMYKKVQRNVYLLQHSRYFLDRASARTFYFQFIYCHLVNGIHIIGNLSCNNALNRLFLLQKRAFRIIANVHYISYHLIPTESLIQSLRLLPLPKLVCYFTSLFAHKINNFLSPPFIYKGFKTNNRFSFRDKHLLVYHTDKLRHKVSITYNALPLHLRSKEKLKPFKSLLYNHFLST